MTRDDPPSKHVVDPEVRWDPMLPTRSAAASRSREAPTREAVLMLLTDGEMARLRAMHRGPPLGEGEQYVNLEDVEGGVRRVHAGTSVVVHNLVPRRAVGAVTWSRMCKLLAR